VRKILAVLVILAALAGLLVYVQGERRRAMQRVDNLERELDRLREENETLREELPRTRDQRAGGQDVTVYFVFSGKTEFSLAPELRRVVGENLPLEALQELAKGPSEGSRLNRSLPEGTRVLGLEVKDGIAYANFSREIMENFNWGSSLEGLMVAAIANTLTEFPQIQGVLVLVEGKQVETLGGHLSAKEIFRRNEEVIHRLSDGH
jgi:spore germination protein GerM